MSTCLTVPGEIVPKPRMTKSDKWKRRDCVLRYREWCDKLRLCAAQARVKLHFTPVRVSYIFAFRGIRRLDIDNCIKSVNDALNEVAWPDDSLKIVRAIGSAEVLDLCEGCERRDLKKKKCRPEDKRGCTQGFTKIVIEEIPC